MARPPLALGTHGNITVRQRGREHVARCRYRDYDGVTRQIERSGPSKTAANRNLQDALRELRGPTDEPLRPDSKLERGRTAVAGEARCARRGRHAASHHVNGG